MRTSSLRGHGNTFHNAVPAARSTATRDERGEYLWRTTSILRTSHNYKDMEIGLGAG